MNMTSIVPFQKNINMEFLDTIRRKFLEEYYRKGSIKTYPNVFEYQKIITDLNFTSAYNHCILLKGDDAEFSR